MRIPTLVYAGLATIAGAVAVDLWWELRAERESPTALRAQSNAIEERASVPAVLARPTATMASGGAPAAPAEMKPEPTTRMPDVARMLAADAARQKALQSDPEYRKARLAQVRMALPKDYPGLVEELGLTAEEAGKLFDLLAEVQAEKLGASMDNPIMLGEPGDVAAIQDLMHARQDIRRRRDETLVTLLGNARFDQFRKYEEERPVRGQASILTQTLAGTLASAGQPLIDVQEGALGSLFLAEAKRKQEFSRTLAVEGRLPTSAEQIRSDQASIEFQAESNRRIVEAAQLHLSAGQIDTLRTMLDQPLALSRAALRVRREQSQAVEE